MNFPVRNGAAFLVNSLSYDVSLTGHVKSEHSAGSELEGTGINFRVWLLFNLSNAHLFTTGLCFDFFCKIME